MKQDLNTRRLSKFLSLFWMEHSKALFFLLLAVGAMLTLWLGIYLVSHNANLFSERMQIGYYFTGLFLSGCLSANFLFAHLHNKPKSISYLLLPASAAEKLLITLFVGTAVYLVGYSTIFYMIEPIFVITCNKITGSNWTIINIFRIDQYENPFLESEPSSLFLLYFTTQACFITGSLYFRKYSFFKTVIALLFVWVFVGFLQVRVILSVLPAGRFFDNLTAYEILDFKGNRLVEMPIWFTYSYKIFFSYLITLGLWVSSYFLLREKEIS